MTLEMKILEHKDEWLAEGLAKGLSLGKIEGKAEGKLQAYAELLEKGVFTVREAANYMGITEAEFKQRLEELKAGQSLK